MPRPKSTSTTKKTQVKKTSSVKAKAKKISTSKVTTQGSNSVKAKAPLKATKLATAKSKENNLAEAERKVTKITKPAAKRAKITSKKTKVTAKEIAKKIDKNIEPHALNDDVTEKVRELIHLSREQGYLTYKNIDQSLPEIANQPEELQNVISIFNNSHHIN